MVGAAKETLLASRHPIIHSIVGIIINIIIIRIIVIMISIAVIAIIVLSIVGIIIISFGRRLQSRPDGARRLCRMLCFQAVT